MFTLSLLMIVAVETLSQDERVVHGVIVPSRESYFVDEDVPLTLRVHVESEFLKSRAIQLFRREMDIPVQVSFPGLEEVPGMTYVRTDTSGAFDRGGTLAINEDIRRAHRRDDEVIEGRTYAVYELTLVYKAKAPMDVLIKGAEIHYAYATRFEEDFINGRVPIDRHDRTESIESAVVRVRVVPEKNRPASFDGAVGRFSFKASVGNPSARIGESLLLLLTIEGEGNIQSIAPPDLTVLPGIHVLGYVESRTEQKAMFTYDLIPLNADVREIPSIEFSYFDPNLNRYQTERSSPISIVVVGDAEIEPELMPETDLLRAGENDVFDIKEKPERTLGELLKLRTLILYIGSPWSIALGVLLWKRRLELKRLHPERFRAKKAASRFHRRMKKSDSDVADAFAGYLADRLGCTSVAVVSPFLRERLCEHRIPVDLSTRTSHMMEGLIVKRFESIASPIDRREVSTLARELDYAFRARERES